ncbi:unnamed protein product [Boreogadus saida]
MYNERKKRQIWTAESLTSFRKRLKTDLFRVHLDSAQPTPPTTPTYYLAPQRKVEIPADTRTAETLQVLSSTGGNEIPADNGTAETLQVLAPQQGNEIPADNGTAETQPVFRRGLKLICSEHI